MTKYVFGEPSASHVLVQLVDDHDLSVIENEAAAIRELAGGDFLLMALKVNSWNRDLSPWKAPAVFGNEDFGEGAGETLETVLKELGPVVEGKRYFIGGYSLAGLFALWAVYQTDVFAGAAAASPSLWFPGFTEFMKEREILAKSVYLSLGDREEKTRNAVMATIGERIREAYDLLCGVGVDCVLEWNKGNHFQDPDLRTAKAFAWLIRSDRGKTVRVAEKEGN